MNKKKEERKKERKKEMMMGSALLIVILFLAALIPLSISVTITGTDSHALLSFKSSISDHSDALSSWSASSSPCTKSWLGVTCRKNRVTRLVLENLNLSGPIEPLLHLDQLRLLSLKSNNLNSPLPLDLSPLTNIKLLFLSRNHLSGPFPSGLLHLRRLRRLDLSQNRLSGHIPPELTQLPHLITLRLDRNSFTGTLFNFPLTLEDFNVSGNSLVGEIPKSLSVFPSSSFAGNENLCGKPLQSRCSNGVARSDPMPVLVSGRRRRMSGKAIVAIVFADVAAMGLVVGVLFYCCCWRRRRRRNGGDEEKEKEMKRGSERRRCGEEEMVFFEGCEGFERVEDLLRASAEMLGKGSVGTTYKAVVMAEEGGGGLGGGEKVVVVKRVRERRKKVVEVDGLMREIGRLRHENVVPLRAYYFSKDEMLLVYDFMLNGSLHSMLHGNRGPGRTPLDWSTRLKLAAGAARGLAFLHHACESKRAHGHLTSLNILVDQEGNACISDFALDQLVHPSPPLSSSSPNKAYKAPELVDNTSSASSKASQKSDVYSFGIVLLEILTGKMAGEGEGEGMDLVKWVRSNAAQEDLMLEVFDLELLRYKEMEVEMVALLQVAFLCLNHMPRERPKMSVVHKMIEDIRTRGAGGGGVVHSPSPNDLSSNSSPCLSEDTPTFASS